MMLKTTMPRSMPMAPVPRAAARTTLRINAVKVGEQAPGFKLKDQVCGPCA